MPGRDPEAPDFLPPMFRRRSRLHLASSRPAARAGTEPPEGPHLDERCREISRVLRAVPPQPTEVAVLLQCSGDGTSARFSGRSRQFAAVLATPRVGKRSSRRRRRRSVSSRVVTPGTMRCSPARAGSSRSAWWQQCSPCYSTRQTVPARRKPSASGFSRYRPGLSAIPVWQASSVQFSRATPDDAARRRV